MLFARNHVVQAAIADVVGPAISANGPEADPAEHVAQVVQLLEPLVVPLLLFKQRLKPLHQLVVDAAPPWQKQVVLLLLTHHKVLLQQLLQLLAHLHTLVLQRLVNLERQVVPPLLEGPPHPEAELSIVLEERVGPSGTLALRVHCVWEGRVRRAPDRRAACGVRDDEALAEELREELHMRSLAASLASAAELEVGLLEL
mmetsp:Transcript_50874/g.140827  ORF Transcript_50874/g.140827 Transcript_50874/m.140827 type:complete len:200 (+) Transcript_50874:2150-2749(+)